MAKRWHVNDIVLTDTSR